MKMTLRKTGFFLGALGVGVAMLLILPKDAPPRGNGDSAVFKPNNSEIVTLLGVKPLEVVSVAYPVDLDFGKGKVALFELSLPTEEPFRIETVSTRLEGATAFEIPELWLRFNSVRVYTKTRVSGP